MSRSVATVLLANIVLALSGILRDALVAAYFGLSPAADAYSLAWFVIDLLGNLLLASTVAAVAIPHLAGGQTWGQTMQSGSPSEPAAGPAEIPPDALGPLLGAVLVAAAALGAAVLIFAGTLTRFLDPTLTPPMSGAAAAALRWLVPYLVAMPVLAAVSAALQLRARFAVPAFAPGAITFLVAIGALLFGPGKRVVDLACWTAGAALVTLTWPLAAAAREKLRLWPVWPARDVRRALLASGASIGLWYMLGQAGQAVDRFFGGRLGPGTVAGLGYAFRFQQAPTWVFAAAVTTVAYPALARAGVGRGGRTSDLLHRAMVVIALGAVPAAWLLGLYAAPVVGLLLGHGVLSPAGTARIAAAVTAFAPGIPAATANALLFRTLFAAGRSSAATYAAALALAVQAAGDAVLAPRFGLAGIGAAGAAAQWAACLICASAASDRLLPGGLCLRRGCSEAIRVALLSLPAALVWVAAILRPGAFWSRQPLGWVLPVTAGLIVYGVVAWVFQRRWSWLPLLTFKGLRPPA